jgi:replicative DNA helicase
LMLTLLENQPTFAKPRSRDLATTARTSLAALIRELHTTENRVQDLKTAHEKELAELKTDHQRQIFELEAGHAQELTDQEEGFEAIMEESEEELEELRDKFENQEYEIYDLQASLPCKHGRREEAREGA